MDEPSQAPTDHEATYELLHSEVSGKLDRLREANDRLDSKASWLGGFALTAAAILLGQDEWTRLSVLAVAFLFLALTAAVVTFWPRALDDPPKPSVLKGYGEDERARVLGRLIGTKAGAYQANVEGNTRKVWGLRVVGASLVAGIFLAILGALST